MIFRPSNRAADASVEGQGPKKTRLRAAIAAGVVVAAPVIGLATANSAHAASQSTWDAVAQCESTGNWSINTGNGFSGGLQFTQSTWDEFGGQQYAASAYQATEGQQISVAEKVLASQGVGAWPVCGPEAGLSQSDVSDPADTSGGSATTSSSQSDNSSDQQSSDQQSSSDNSGSNSDDTQSSSSDSGDNSAPASTGSNSGSGNGTYTIQSGDTLSGIAAANGESWQSLYAKNTSVVGSNPDVIYPGQTITL